ncbi:nicotinate phosphoribosyltransferase [Campylobacter sp.]|jgi:putative nucleotide phosphoribosyltransferase|uniref:nicotinate phosphoribosyltransferase n=1 Tax=Campylobacter sp. TaxID=205 RepID=UPI003FA01828
MSEEKMLEMINATADIIFMAVLRGKVSFEACKKDKEIIDSLREELLSKNPNKLKISQDSHQIIQIFEKYRNKR